MYKKSIIFSFCFIKLDQKEILNNNFIENIKKI
jgi:hypothetical protein